MPADNKLELVIQVDSAGANASIKSVNTSLSGLEKTAWNYRATLHPLAVASGLAA